MTLRAIRAMALAFTKAYFRNKAAIFFTLLFPVIFLLIFGTIFGKQDQVSFSVKLINESPTQIAQALEETLAEIPVFEFSEQDTPKDLSTLKTQLGRGEIDAIIILPPDFGRVEEQGYPTGELRLLYNQSDEQLGATMTAVLEDVFKKFNARIIPVDQPFTISSEPLQTADLSRFDYVFAGLLGFAILSLGVFSMSEGFIQDKKTKALLRIRLAPVKAWQLILATIANRILVGLLAIGLLFIISLLVFDFNMRGDYLHFLLFSTLSITCLLGFGTVIAGWAKDSQQAAPLASLISFPMMFLSGVFFPVFLMPPWLQSVTAFIPLTPVVDGLRLILTENYALWDLGPQILIILCWTVGLYALASKTFRWE